MPSLAFPADDSTPNPTEVLRTCTGCGESLPLSAYSVYSRTGKPFSRCKPCQAAATKASRAKLDPEEAAENRKANYDANREARVESSRAYRERKRVENPKPPKPMDDGTRKCTKCHEVKDKATEFYVKVKATGRLYSWCKSCHRVMTEETRKANLERYAEYSRDSCQRNPVARAKTRKKYESANQDKIRESRRRYWKANPEKLKAKKARNFQQQKPAINARLRKNYRERKELMVGRIKRWAAANPERFAAIRARADHRRRDREALTPCTLTGAEWKDILRLQGNRCGRCNRPFTMKRKPCKDHIVPLSKGGGLTFQNCQALCGKCNNQKYVDDTDYRGLIPGLLV